MSNNIEPHPPLATMAGQKKLHAVTVASQKKDHKQP
jgi:hypothetical protein